MVSYYCRLSLNIGYSCHISAQVWVAAIFIYEKLVVSHSNQSELSFHVTHFVGKVKAAPLLVAMGNKACFVVKPGTHGTIPLSSTMPRHH